MRVQIKRLEFLLVKNIPQITTCKSVMLAGTPVVDDSCAVRTRESFIIRSSIVGVLTVLFPNIVAAHVFVSHRSEEVCPRAPCSSSLGSAIPGRNMCQFWGEEVSPKVKIVLVATRYLASKEGWLRPNVCAHLDRILKRHLHKIDAPYVHGGR